MDNEKRKRRGRPRVESEKRKHRDSVSINQQDKDTILSQYDTLGAAMEDIAKRIRKQKK